MFEGLKKIASRILNKDDYEDYAEEITSSGCEDEQEKLPC